MASVLIIHYDKTVRVVLEAMTKRQFETSSAKNVEAGVKMLHKQRPDAIVVGHDSAKKEASRLLTYLRDNGIKIPVIVMVGRGGGIFQQQLMKLGVQAFIEYPAQQRTFEEAITTALTQPDQPMTPEDNAPTKAPPLVPEELRGNLTVLEKTLNKNMRCVVGRNQVFIRSLISGQQGAHRPRICLKCPLRADLGLVREVYFEFIRDVCCTDISKCQAIQQQKARRSTM